MMGQSNINSSDTIAAIATPQGKGGVGIVRISGVNAHKIAKNITGKQLKARHACYTKFKDPDSSLIDQGVALYFCAPHSFTGEDIVELQGHGGPVVMDMLLDACIQLGARQANPGEFSQRAFLNDKLDLTQAEAIADLIESSTQQAAKGAMQSLQGMFSEKINDLLHQLIELRMFVEAAMDFPEEEIDFLADSGIQIKLTSLQQQVDACLLQSQQGQILKNGLRVVLAGAPNVGKSSLLNALAGKESAIVTDIPGTTRDTIEVTINLGGLAVHVTDTAGLRDSHDQVEKIGIQRSHQAMQLADHILFIMDISKPSEQIKELRLIQETYGESNITPVWNKSDLKNKISHHDDKKVQSNELVISVKHHIGLDVLEQHLKTVFHTQIDNETQFTARRRHVYALEQTQKHIEQGVWQLTQNKASELLAQELLMAQNQLNEITGEFRADDLLGKIFNGFCIGK